MITEIQTIWFPGVYEGRNDSEYLQTVADVPLSTIIGLVRMRADEDGEWAIANGFVEGNEDKMRRMMAYVADEKNIQSSVSYILKRGLGSKHTVDYVCRDLANAAKWAVK